MTQPFRSVSVNWDGYNVPALWAMVESEQEWANREQVGAWMRMHDMLAAHQENLQRIREAIAELWPPEGSTAARLFLGRLNTMIKSAQDASYAARSNASALNLLTDALLEARSGIEPLHRAWQSATPQQQVRLNQQARATMTEADARVVEHGNQFTPPPGVPSPIETTPVDPFATQRSSTVPREGVVPPLEGSHGGSGSGWGGESSPVGAGAGAAGGSDGLTDPGVAPRPVPGPEAWPGPVLTGAPSPSLRLPVESTAAGATPSRASTLLDTLQMRALPAGGVLALPPPAVDRLPGSLTGPHRMPNGGTDPVAVDEPGRGVAPVRAGGRTPVTGGLPAAEGGMQAGGLIGGGFGGAGLRPLGTIQRRYPADDEWEQPAGVAPVIQPGPEPDPRTAFDPGPNVIGGRR